MPRHKKNFSHQNGKRYGKHKTHSGTVKKKPRLELDRKKRNYRFIARSKEAEEAQRRQKLVEDKYKAKNTVVENESFSEDENDQVNPFDQLVAGFGSKSEGNTNNVIESSESESEQNDDDEDEIDEVENEEIEGDEEEDIDGELETDDEQDLEMDEEETDEDDEEISDDEEDKNDAVATDVEMKDTNEEDLDEETENHDSRKASKSTDPFAIHLDYDLSPDLLESLSNKPIVIRKIHLQWPVLGNIQIEIPTTKKSQNSTNSLKLQSKSLLDEIESFATEGEQPQVLSAKSLDLVNCSVKPQLHSNLQFANSENSTKHELTSLQAEIFSILNNYQDLFYPNRTLINGDEIRLIYSLHALNHMLKTRTRVLHHNAKITAATNNKKQIAIMSDSYRDQGLIRPKVLILLPFRDSAYRLVNLFIKLLYGDKEDQVKSNGTVINYKRFEEEFTGDSLRFPQRNPKPEDYEKTFSGNTDDTFRIGISSTKKCIKLYTEFYSSDILIASPLGLRMIIGAPGEAERDYDFLASIELLILDQAELFLAQNWDHLLHVFDHLHLQPQSSHDTDFSRVRSWSLNGWSRFYRQTMLFTTHELPEFRSLFNSRCCNYRGKVRIANSIVDGSIRQVITQIPQVFHKIDVSSIETSFDLRFKYFINEILPQFSGPSMAHCMIYVPSYFDYVRLRNHFKTETINFVQICEYTKDAKIARARDMFFHSAAHFLLYSERAHFFRRTRIKGIRHLIMYQPPCWPHFYSELINLMQDGNQNPRDGLESSMSVTMLYTKYDILQVSAIIGTERAGKILQSSKTTHMFMTGD